jgi:hypothetical protein
LLSAIKNLLFRRNALQLIFNHFSGGRVEAGRIFFGIQDVKHFEGKEHLWPVSLCALKLFSIQPTPGNNTSFELKFNYFKQFCVKKQKIKMQVRGNLQQ